MGEVTFTFRVADDLKDAFSEAARAHDRTAAQLLRDYMRTVVQRQREDDSYETWLGDKVEAARKSARAGRYVSGEDAAREEPVRYQATRSALPADSNWDDFFDAPGIDLADREQPQAQVRDPF